MAVDLRPDGFGPLEPVTWPTGEVVPVTCNLYASNFWNRKVMPALTSGSDDAADLMVQFVAMVCPSKTVEQIMEECDEAFLLIVSGYARRKLDAALELLGVVSGKSEAGTAPPSDPMTPSGTSPAVSPAPTAGPCGT
jgi:hypothetical protein